MGFMGTASHADSASAINPVSTLSSVAAGSLADMPLERLEAELCQGAANLTAGEHGWLLQLAEFERRRGWEVRGCHSCVHWLVWQEGLDGHTAREKVRYPAW